MIHILIPILGIAFCFITVCFCNGLRRQRINLFPEFEPESTKKWVKIGQVIKLNIYPLLYGNPLQVKELVFTTKGLYTFSKRRLLQWDSMFLVYDPNTMRCITLLIHPKIEMVQLTYIDERNVKLKAVWMPEIVFDVWKATRDNQIVQCSYFSRVENSNIQLTDCGAEVATWISMCLINKNEGLRLGRRTNLGHSMYEKNALNYINRDTTNPTNYLNRKTCPFLTSYELVSFGWKLPEFADRIPLLKVFSPHIIISLDESYQPSSRETLRIDDIIIKNFGKSLWIFNDTQGNEQDRIKTLKINKYVCRLQKPGCIKEGTAVYVYR